LPSPLQLIAIMGTTASGKTELAEALADRLHARLINSDAFQIYRGMDIGTAKSSRKAEYALVDVRRPDEPFGVGEWVRLAQMELAALAQQSRSAVVVGGTGLYVRALFEEYAEMAGAPPLELREELNQWSLEALQAELLDLDTPAYERVDLKNRVRVQRAVERARMAAAPEAAGAPPETHSALSRFSKFKFAVEWDPCEVDLRIASRTAQMVQDGWPEEVARLREEGFVPRDPGMRAHGYRHIWSVLEGKMEISQAIDLTTQEVRRYAKRQRTWLRKEPGLISLDRDGALESVLRHLGMI
jgi:tRNA dimethylallyltransferase